MNKYSEIVQQFKVFYEQHAGEAAQQSGWQQRHTKLNGQSWLEVVVLGWHRNPRASLQGLACWADELGLAITPQAIQARINERAVVYLTQLIQRAVGHLRSQQGLVSAVLQAWKHVYLVDSTQIALPDHLRDQFAGCQKTNAQLKTHVGFDYLTGQVVALELVAGRSPDQKSTLPRQIVQPDDLVLLDLGYFSLAQVQGIAQQGAFFITPLQSQVALYIPATETRIALLPLLKTQTTPCDQWVDLGTEQRLPVRLIARRRSPQQADHYRQQALVKAQSAGQKVSPAHLERLGWDILVTNLPDPSPATLWLLYGVRWQIEMVFKLWKSHLHLDQVAPYRPARLLCQWLALLLGAILFHGLLTPAQQDLDYELSPARAYVLLQSRYRDFCFALRRASATSLITWFTATYVKLRRLATVEKRLKSPSTRQRLLTWHEP